MKKQINGVFSNKILIFVLNFIMKIRAYDVKRHTIHFRKTRTF